MISFLKVVGILLSGVFGIVGQVKDFRDKETGKITVWGRRNLVGLIVSLSLTLAAETFNLIKKRDEADQAAKEAKEAALRAETLVRQTSWLLDPLVDLRFTFVYSYPLTDPRVANYRKRLEAAYQQQRKLNPQVAEEIVPVDGFGYAPDPSKDLAAYSLLNSNVELEAYVIDGKTDIRSDWNGDLYFLFQENLDSLERKRLGLSPNVSHKALQKARETEFRAKHIGTIAAVFNVKTQRILVTASAVTPQPSHASHYVTTSASRPPAYRQA
jgi:hypothetical protein